MSDRVSTMGGREFYMKSASAGADNDRFLPNIDTKGAREVGIAVNLSPFAYSSTNKLKFELQHSDTATSSDYEDVPHAEIVGGDGATDGLLVEQASTVAPNTSVKHKFNYRGSKRYIRVGTDVTGATTGDFGVAVMVSTLREQPR